MTHAPYKYIEECTISKDGIILEIGSERGHGSTRFLADFAVKNGMRFVTVDFEEEACKAAQKICEPSELTQLVRCVGESWLPGLKVPVSFAYLDNFDWIWDRSNPKQVETYKQYGFELSNRNSQLAHLRQVIEIEKARSLHCAVVFDDSWIDDHGVFMGKGGAAATYLEALGWKLLNQPGGENQRQKSFIAMGAR